MLQFGVIVFVSKPSQLSKQSSKVSPSFTENGRQTLAAAIFLPCAVKSLHKSRKQYAFCLRRYGNVKVSSAAAKIAAE